MVSQRILSIKDAATKLFLTQGYSKTQISHIAGEVGVSVGTIYHDFNGKKEIMHFVLKSTIDPDFLGREIQRPIGDEIFEGLEQEIAAAFEESEQEFARHLIHAGEDYTFEQLISDTFDLLEKYGVGCLFIEKNQFEFKGLAKSYKAYRQNFMETMTRYLKLFMEKREIRQVENLELTTVMIVEILTWWAIDMRYTSFDHYDISREAAKKVCMDHLLYAYGK